MSQADLDREWARRRDHNDRMAIALVVGLSIAFAPLAAACLVVTGLTDAAKALRRKRETGSFLPDDLWKGIL